MRGRRPPRKEWVKVDESKPPTVPVRLWTWTSGELTEQIELVDRCRLVQHSPVACAHFERYGGGPITVPISLSRRAANAVYTYFREDHFGDIETELRHTEWAQVVPSWGYVRAIYAQLYAVGEYLGAGAMMESVVSLYLIAVKTLYTKYTRDRMYRTTDTYPSHLSVDTRDDAEVQLKEAADRMRGVVDAM